MTHEDFNSTTMTQTAPSKDDPLEIDATLVRPERYTPVWAPLLKPVVAIVDLLPSHRNTKKGRQTAKQVRLVIMGVGLAVLIFGGTLPLILVGGAIMASALVLPLSEVKKSGVQTKLRKLGSQRTRPSRQPVQIIHDGKRLSLQRDSERIRRVLVDRGEHRVELRRRGQTPYLGVRPASERKSEAIWIASPQHGSVPEEAEEITGDAIDIRAEVAPNDWRVLYDRLS
jgi:hypothetical protein